MDKSGSPSYKIAPYLSLCDSFPSMGSPQPCFSGRVRAAGVRGLDLVMLTKEASSRTEPPRVELSVVASLLCQN